MSVGGQANGARPAFVYIAMLQPVRLSCHHPHHLFTRVTTAKSRKWIPARPHGSAKAQQELDYNKPSSRARLTAALLSSTPSLR